MFERLKGKTIIVAGAGGIGDALAQRYAAEGATVIVADIAARAAEQVVAQIAASGGTAQACELDGADDRAWGRLIEVAHGRFGGLDGLHINFAHLADGSKANDILQLDMDDWDEAMRVNARGYVLGTRHALPVLRERGGGSIVYTASNAAYVGEPMRVAYAMSKGALLPLMRHVANRFGPEGIRCNAIAPGVILHERLESGMPDAIKTAFAGDTALKHLGKPMDIAAVGALLMSDEGAFITGQVIAVDGGGFMRP